MVREKNKYYPVAYFGVECPHCHCVRDRIRALTLGSIVWCEECGKTFDMVLPKSLGGVL